MPTRNRVKQWRAGEVYHVFNRGNDRQPVFMDDQDYSVFIGLFNRHLSKRQMADRLGRPYKNWHNDIELLAFCMMPSHFHLLIFQENERSISYFMRSLMTAYVSYFNWKYRREGHLFHDIFKAKAIPQDKLVEVSRYIHRNPYEWQTWEWSSLPYYEGDKRASWLRPERVLQQFSNEDYSSYIADYQDYKKKLDQLEDVVAD